MTNKINIAIDGPSGSGKSTTAKLLAEKLKMSYLDTGSMYRAITWYWMNHLNSDLKKLESEISNLKINFKNQQGTKLIEINGLVPGDELYTDATASNVSQIATLDYVRKELVRIQREVAQNKGYILDGRDIGTVVLPDAELKIFLVASAEKRAERRLKELTEKGFDTTFENVINNLKERDRIDSTRENAPLKKADDAIEISTDDISIEEQVEKISKLASNKLNNN